MLKTLSVTGFRSLLDFEIAFRPGLNVLVGTNGAGKSNFVAALDFLSKFLSADLHDGLASIGGAASAFSLEALANSEPEFTLDASGVVDRDQMVRSAERFGINNEDEIAQLKGVLSYSYRCRITYIKKSAVVHVSEEMLRLGSPGSPDFTVARTTRFVDGKVQTSIEFTPPNHPWIDHLFRFRAEKEDRSLEELVASYLRPQTTIVRWLANPFTPFGEVYFDLSNLSSINIDPQAAKKPTPIPHPEELQSTGQGLAATLYALQHGQYTPSPTRFFRFRGRSEHAQRRSFRSILSWAKEVHSGISNISTALEPAEVVIKPFVQMQSHTYPFSKLSDGTIKWIALTTVLVAEPQYSVIEEPENFLHPRMQELFVKIARESAGLGAERPFLVVTTHSETLLNACRPDELIVLYRSDEGTKATRIENSEELQDRLNKSVFGLGYVYRTGGIDEGDTSVS